MKYAAHGSKPLGKGGDREGRGRARTGDLQETDKNMTLRPYPDVLEFSGGSGNCPLDELGANVNEMSTTSLFEA